MTRFEGVEMLLQEGDIITSKKGIIFKDCLIPGRGQIVHKVKYRGKGGWEVMESKTHPREFVDMEKIEDRGASP